jgi:AraC-like DNA-binding protein
MPPPSDTESASAAAPRAELHLASAPQFDAFEIWQASLANLFDTTLVGENAAARFHGDVTGFHLGDSLTFDNASVAQRLVRTAQRVRRSGVDHIMLQYQTSGRLVGDYDGRAVTLNPGDIGFVDFGRVTASEDTDFSRTTLIVPRERLPMAFRARDLHGVVLDGNHPSTRLLARYMTALWQSAGQLLVQDVPAAVDAAFVLAEGAWNGLGSANVELRPEARQTLRRMAMTYIDRRLAQQDLSPLSIAAGLRISRSALYTLFEPEGGIESYIFARRLDRCFDAIVSDRARTAGIGEIALANGFKSEAHFSRAFSGRFGLNPSEVRRIATARALRTSAERDDGSAAMTFADWIRMLGSGDPAPYA